MPPHISAPYTGRLVVRLRQQVVDLMPTWGPGQYEGEDRLLRALDLFDRPSDLRDQLRRYYPSLPSIEAFAPFSAEQVVRLEDRARYSPFPPLHSLRAYYIIDPRESLTALEVAAFLADLQNDPSVELAYRETNVRNAAPPVTPGNETIYPTGSQQHFDGFKWGINAAAPSVWGKFDGAGIGFADLEAGWNLDHTDLPKPKPPLYNVNTAAGRSHGTAVLGIVVGQDNGKGIVGIAPGATFKKVLSHIRTPMPPWPMDSWDIVGAILDAMSPGVLVPGDVLLIEIETLGNSANIGYPIEISPLWFDAIRLAVGNGIVVIEPAGNGDALLKGRDLDAWNGEWNGTPTGRQLKAGDALSDSGAIIVSGCARAIAPANAHRHFAELNYGSRVTCYGWGEQVYSAGGDESLSESPGTANDKYTSNFRATSAASAIIAGAAILVQQMYEQTYLRRLAPAQIRHLLGDWSLGTKVVNAADAQIGVMPDLAKIALQLGAIPDVYVRDSVSDAGVVPNTNVFQSPDIILRKTASPNPDTEFGQASPLANQVPANDPAVANQDNHIYVRIRNRAAVDANAVTATIYWSEASALVAPIDWHLIGQINAGKVNGGDTLHVAGPFVWHPAPGEVPASGHGCFVVVLDQALDPQPPSLPAAVGTTNLGWGEFLSYVGNNNNIAWRNFDVLQGLSAMSAPLPFGIPGSWEESREFGLELVAQLPEGAEVVWEMPAELGAAVARASGRHLLGHALAESGRSLQIAGSGRVAVSGVRLERMAQHQCRLHVELPERRSQEEHYVAIRQIYEGICVGQVTWSFVERGVT
jgi:serine protease